MTSAFSDANASSQIAEPIPFTKMSGSGNDFIVIDNRTGLIAPADSSAFARAVCRHRLSVGADGVVLIEEALAPDADFRWRYINADGSDGEMCGNGAMCGARFAVMAGIAPNMCRFETASGVIQAHVAESMADPLVRIAMESPGEIAHDVRLAVDGRALTVDRIIVGVPHVIVIVNDVDEFAPGDELTRIGRAVRHHSAFQPAGTNFNVIAVLSRQRIRMRTYERGVEAETLACGTGAVASAIDAVARGLVDSPVEVVTSSGRTLRVWFRWDGRLATEIHLAGEALVVAKGEIWPEAFQ